MFIFQKLFWMVRYIDWAFGKLILILKIFFSVCLHLYLALETLELTLFHLNVMYSRIKLTFSMSGWLIVNKCSTFDILMMVWKRYFVWENVWHEKYKNIVFCFSKIEHPISIEILLLLKIIVAFHLLFVSQVMQSVAICNQKSVAFTTYHN